MVGKSLMKHHCLKKKNFIATKYITDAEQLNRKDITDADNLHVKRVCKNFDIKNLGEYHDFHFKSDTLILANFYKNFRKIY